MFDSSRIPDTIFDVLAVRASLLDDGHDDALRHLVAVHLKALDYLHISPDDAAYRLAPLMQLPPERVMATFRGLVLPDLSNNRRLLSGNPSPLHSAALKAAAVMRGTGILRRSVELEGPVYTGCLPVEES